MAMIHFRCWYCNKHYSRPTAGERIACNCGHQLRVPRRNFGNSRTKTLGDWLVEALVYGGGGALLGLGAALIIGAIFVRIPFMRGGTIWIAAVLIPISTV